MTLTLHTRLLTYNEYTSLNRASKYMAASRKKAVEEEILYELLEQGAGQFPAGQKHFDFSWYTKHKRQDPDNIASSIKFIFDAFVKGGYMDNDGWKDVGTIYHMFHTTTAEERVEIYIYTDTDND